MRETDDAEEETAQASGLETRPAGMSAEEAANFQTLRHAKFAAEYLKCGNATEAAKRAGYEGPRHYLFDKGKRLLRRSDISAYLIDKLGAIMSTQEVAARLSNFGRASIGNFITIDDDGQPYIDLTKQEAQQNLSQIKRIKHGRYGIELEVHNPVTALAFIAKLYRLGSQEDLQRRQVEMLLAMLPSRIQDAVKHLMAIGTEWEDEEGFTPALPAGSKGEERILRTGDPGIGEGDEEEFEGQYDGVDLDDELDE